jgi:hypothetical protein
MRATLPFRTNNMKTYLTIASLFASGAVAMATSVSSFGTLSAATWGGSGIDNNNATITTITTPGTAAASVITLGLEANPRLTPGVLANNGVNTYYTAPGAAAGHPTWASWNMGFFIGAGPNNTLGLYSFTLTYGLEGGASATFDPLLIGDNTGAPNSAQNSENLGFAFLSIPIGGFDPNASGIYDFTLKAYLDGVLLGSDSAKVVVGSVPDGGSTIAMLGFAACGLFVFKRATKVVSAK